jgi:hypothetical protein
MTQGIYTLANDVVYDQLIALLNSIEVNIGKDFPVSVIPYDDRLEKIKLEIERRKNVQLLDNPDIIKRWEYFSTEIWQSHPKAFKMWQEKGILGVNRMGMHRRFCAFDQESPFDQFIFFDGDVLVLNSLDYVFNQLNHNEMVVYDFQHKDPSHVYDLNSAKLFNIFEKSRIESEIFCAGFYCSKRGLFNENQRQYLLEKLQNGEAEILYMNGPDQAILNYMTMKLGVSVYNFALNLPKDKITGNAVTSTHFEYKDHVLYDKGVRLTYLHYIGVPSNAFTRLCNGENLELPYRDIFLHYRYLHEPEKMPQFSGKPKPYNPPPTVMQKVMKKLGFQG